MGYSEIDPELNAWATKHALHIFTQYRDDEVRLTEVIGRAGKKCHIWVNPPDDAGTFVVNVWNYKKKQAKRIKELPASKSDIRTKLEEAYQTAQEWLNEEARL